MTFQAKFIKKMEEGMPDLILLKDGKTTFVELKKGNDILKDLQKFRIDELRKKGFQAYCWHEKNGIIY
jgi:hypothetical protein